MRLSDIAFFNFRTIEQANYSFEKKLTVFSGKNSRGKTTIIEGIYTNIYGTGFRQSKDEELIRWGQTRAYIGASIENGTDKQLFHISIEKKNNGIDKNYTHNKCLSTYKNYFQYHTRAVLFTPEMIDIIIGSPEKRRSYIDHILSTTDIMYKKKLQNYQQALRRRNKLFETQRNQALLKEELVFWNNYLIENSNYIIEKRKQYINKLNDNSNFYERNFYIQYEPNEFTEENANLVFEKEKQIRKTLIGPQKDIILFFLFDGNSKKNVHLYGSRSEQRLTIFWLKLHEAKYLEEINSQKPILLFDDIFSELDNNNKKIVTSLLTTYQTVITTTDEDDESLYSNIEKSIFYI